MSSALTGITAEKGAGRLWRLLLSFSPAAPAGVEPVDVLLTDVKGGFDAGLPVVAVEPPPPGGTDLAVTVRDDRPVRLLGSQGDPRPVVLTLVGVDGVDPRRSQAAFLLEGTAWKDDEEEEDVLRPARGLELPAAAGPEIDYMARDYAAVRQMLLDQLSLHVPGWEAESPADLLVTLAEVLAYSADQLAYFQDAVATEAYLETARRRLSVQRHARLVDYFLHGGTNARAWVCFTVGGDLRLPKGTPLLTRVPGVPGPVAGPGGAGRALAAGALVFETLEDARLSSFANEMALYNPPGEVPYALDQGATRASLTAWYEGLAAGGVLVFEEVAGPATGLASDADPAKRHAVRLTRVTPGGYQRFQSRPDAPWELRPTRTDLEWAPEDALPFPLWIVSLVDGLEVYGLTVARGNAVLADQGRSLSGRTPEPPAVPFGAPYRPSLGEEELTWSEPLAPDMPDAPATRALVQDPSRARPAVELRDGGGLSWQARPDLLESGPYDRVFVAEQDGGGVRLRFGDGVLGRRPAPGTRFTADYRVGNGSRGNVGADAIALAVGGPAELASLLAVRNPLPARGGTDPQGAEAGRLYAPQAFRVQERAVTAADYAAVAERHPEVQKAAASLVWTGSWSTFFVAVDRLGGAPADAAFCSDVAAFLERFRVAGHALTVVPPIPVPVEIALAAYGRPGYPVSAVRSALAAAFGDGGQGFFHPDRFTFGQPVYLSRVIAAAAAVPGVAWIDSDPQSDPRVRFQRWGRPAAGELETGEIAIGPLEVATAGRVRFYVVVDR